MCNFALIMLVCTNRLFAGPGLHFVCWPLKSIVGRLSLRVQQLDVVCETKTHDNVFVQVSCIYLLVPSSSGCSTSLTALHAGLCGSPVSCVR